MSAFGISGRSHGSGSWSPYASLALIYYPVPDIAWPAVRKKDPLETGRVRVSACLALAVGIDCSVILR